MSGIAPKEPSTRFPLSLPHANLSQFWKNSTSLRPKGRVEKKMRKKSVANDDSISPIYDDGQEESAVKEIESNNEKHITQNVVIIRNIQDDLISKQ